MCPHHSAASAPLLSLPGATPRPAPATRQPRPSSSPATDTNHGARSPPPHSRSARFRTFPAAQVPHVSVPLRRPHVRVPEHIPPPAEYPRPTPAGGWQRLTPRDSSPASSARLGVPRLESPGARRSDPRAGAGEIAAADGSNGTIGQRPGRRAPITPDSMLHDRRNHDGSSSRPSRPSCQSLPIRQEQERCLPSTRVLGAQRDDCSAHALPNTASTGR